MASFQAKIGWKGREIEKIKIIVLFRSNPMRNRKFQKNSKIFQKIQFRGIPSQNWLEKAQREKIKIIVPFPSNPTRKRKFKKNSKKIL